MSVEVVGGVWCGVLCGGGSESSKSKCVTAV